jgi:competence protein ComEA
VSESIPAQVKRFAVEHVKVMSAVAFVAVIVATWMVMSAHGVVVDEPTQSEEVTIDSQEVEEPPAPVWVIHVMGAVVSPGVVVVHEGARVVDAIAAAGGLTDSADPAQLNLAAVLSDGCQVMIGTVKKPLGEVRFGTGGELDHSSQSTNPGSSPGSSTININKATQGELETLPGVGPVTAKAILTWRENNGSFTSVSQLQEVGGIGAKTFAQLEPYVSV